MQVYNKMNNNILTIVILNADKTYFKNILLNLRLFHVEQKKQKNLDIVLRPPRYNFKPLNT